MKGSKVNFILNRSYSLVTDYPAPYPKILSNLIQYDEQQTPLSPLFLAELKPLLVGPDLGLSIVELSLRSAAYNQPPEGTEIHPSDQRVLDEA